jgi:hypothetical protein
MTKTSYVEWKLKTLTWGQRGECERCGGKTTSGTAVAIGYEPDVGIETVIECFLCVKKDIGLAYDTEYEYYTGMEIGGAC